jgi:hypothetical protein
MEKYVLRFLIGVCGFILIDVVIIMGWLTYKLITASA